MMSWSLACHWRDKPYSCREPPAIAVSPGAWQPSRRSAPLREWSGRDACDRSGGLKTEGKVSHKRIYYSSPDVCKWSKKCASPKSVKREWSSVIGLVDRKQSKVNQKRMIKFRLVSYLWTLDLQTGVHAILNQGLSRDLETGCLKLAFVNFLGRPEF